MKEKGQKLKICAKKARAANKRRVTFLAKIATRWIYFIHILRQLLVPNLSKSEQKNSVLALGAYYTDYCPCPCPCAASLELDSSTVGTIVPLSQLYEQTTRKSLLSQLSQLFRSWTVGTMGQWIVPTIVNCPNVLNRLVGTWLAL